MAAPRRLPAPAARGYTLLEMVLTVAIVALAATVALPGAAPLTDTRAERAAGEIAEALRFARDESLRTGAVHGVRIERAAQRLTAFRADLGAVPLGQAAVLYRPLSRQPYQLVIGDIHGLAGATIANAGDPFLFADLARRDTVVFDAEGAPVWIDTATGARSPLGEGTVTIDVGGVSRTVRVEPVTGRVTIQ